MADYIVKDETLADIADAIRHKTNSNEKIKVEDFAEQISAISGGNTKVATCTIEIISKFIGTPFASCVTELYFLTYENDEYKKYGGSKYLESGNVLPSGFDWNAEKITLNNVVCGSMIYLEDMHNNMVVSDPVEIMNPALDSYFLFIPPIPDVTHIITI